jgi:DNA-binding winged helix-turn-helix (wHTH) protein
MTVRKPFKLGAWTVDPPTNRLRRNGREVRLEPKVMRVLTYLATRRGEVVARHELESEVWSGAIVTDDALTNTVIMLRKALGDNARQPVYIETIAKSGYRLIADAAPLATEAMEPVSAPVAPMACSLHGQPPARPAASTHSVSVLSRRLALLAVASFVALLVWWLSWRTSNVGPLESAVDVAERPVIAVLQFKDLNADSGNDYLADGVAEDLITDLSKLAGLQVLARNSSFAYRGSR